jgi:sugar lactone lactonase YvrE
LKRLAVFLASALFLCAGTTRTWLQSEASEFEKDQLHGLSLRSDGTLSVAPKTSELFDASSAYLWALARDSKGNLYTGGGPGAKLFQIAPDGTHKKLAEFDALEIHAIAIDTKDQVYAATSPDGKIYRISANGTSDIFYDPKQKYIWGMAFGPQGDLFVATGDAGQIHRVDTNGKGEVFFKTEETHARSIAVDAKGNVLVGTAPGGLILRISPTGTGFVLYQMLKREITAIAAAPDGSVYAAGLANGVPAIIPLPAPVMLAPSPLGGVPPEAQAPRPIVSGGVDVYRINASGAPERVWSNPRDTVYAMAFDREGHPILGTGNKGTLYRIDSNSLSTALLNVSSTQITSLVSGSDGAFYAATANVGKVFRLGPGDEASGTVESEVFDSTGFSQWGRLKAEGKGKIELFSRSGNVDRPHDNWSAWAPVKERSASPPSRFLQWKAVLSAGAELDSVEAAYLPKNVAPKIEEIEITPPNYRFTPPATGDSGTGPAAAITLPALGKKATQGAGLSLDLGIAMNYAKGWIGARWNASDENGDGLLFNVEIRGVKEKDWRPLAEKIREKHYTFDSTEFPDGEYRLRITVSDSPGNVEGEALHSEAISAPFYIDNTPPEISGLSLRRQGSGLQASWKATDALSVIRRAEYSLDDGDWSLVEPTGKLSDSQSLAYELTISKVAAGEHVLAVRVTDRYGNQVVSKAVAD